MTDLVLTDLQIDALKELGNISAGNAATAFSQMVNKKVEMNVPRVQVIPIGDLPGIFGEDVVKVGLYQRILGEASGNILLSLDRQSAFELIDVILGEKSPKPRILSPVDVDFLKELSNIVAGSYLTNLSKMTGFLFMPSVPNLTIDVTKAIIGYLVELNPTLQYALIIFNELRVAGSTISAELFLLPHPNALPLILKAIGV